ncbi:NAD(P)/FAD-dependent oxidoreductase [Natrialbaceae archaeon GCM10025810]|uniref:NAD(P)/FAD-dependent oxidoreductase n=1 Tax=Halovalidus salilacus TaxID=3075124 RepID=UPI003619D035
MTDFDTIIIGGGVAGASCAYHLAAAGIEDVAIFEKDQPASKASGRAAGFITPDQFLSTGTHPPEHQYIIEFWEDMAQETKLELRYDDAYTFAREEDSVSHLNRLHDETAVESRLLTAEELGERVPDLRIDNIELAFMFEDGFSLDPYTATITVLENALALGADLHTEAVESITPHAHGETSVATSERSYTASTVILAAGAWSKALALEIGVTLPLKPRISQIVTLAPESRVHLPLVNDPDLLLYYRTEANGEVLIGGGTGKTELDPETFDDSAREAYLQDVAEKAPKISEKLTNSDITGKWAGLCSATPDRHPLVGQIHPHGIYACCGFNGEGIMYSTVAGHLIADFVTGTPPTFNADAFAPDRFATPEADFEIRSAIEW